MSQRTESIDTPVLIVNQGPLVTATHERMTQIAELISGTQADSLQVEYSALIGLGVRLMAKSLGMRTDDRSLSRFGRLFFRRVAPIVEEVVNDLKA